MSSCDSLGDFRSYTRSKTLSSNPAKAFVTGVLSDLSNSHSTYGFAQKVSRILNERLPGIPAAFIVHGPPSEPVRIHAHFVAVAPPAKLYRDETAVRNALLDGIRDHDTLPSTTFHASRSYRGPERDDDYGFVEWLDRCGFADAISAARAPAEIAETLARFRIAREMYGDGHILRDLSDPDGLVAQAAALGLHDGALRARFGESLLPPASSEPERSFTDERDDKFPQPLRDLHRDARSRWFSDVAPKMEKEQAAVYERAAAWRSLQDTTSRSLLRQVGLPTSQRDYLDAARHIVRSANRIGTERDLRDIVEAHPPRVPRRVGDWLRQLYDTLPGPVASAPHAVLSPSPSERLVDHVDRELYDEHGIIIAHETQHGVELRTTERLPRLEHVTRLELRAGADVSIGNHYGVPVQVIERTPPAAVVDAIDGATPAQLPRWMHDTVLEPAAVADLPGLFEGDDDTRERTLTRGLRRRDRTQRRR